MTNDDLNDELMDDIMATIASMDPDELAEFAELRGMTAAEWAVIIANWKAERNAMTTKPTIVPASDDEDIWIIVPGYGPNRPGMTGLPLTAWRVDGSARDEDVRMLPLTDDPEEFDPVTDCYCLQYGEDGPFKFPDGEVCHTAKEVLASFERRRRGAVGRRRISL